MKRVLVPVFPGTNCERETLEWIRRNLVAEAEALRPEDVSAVRSFEDIAAVIVPGGFSHGDYLRAGALAARSPQMRVVKAAAASGVPVLGICNGFQILCEAGMLPGVLLPNAARHHLHGPVPVAAAAEAFAGAACAWLPPRAALRNAGGSAHAGAEFPAFEAPLSCGMGRYFPGRDGKLAAGARPLFRYADEAHPLAAGVGSFAGLAGIVSADGLVAGMMPHPERASDPVVGGDSGLLLLAGLALARKLGVRPDGPLEHYGRRHDVFA